MELIYPFVLIIGIPVIIVLILLKFKKSDSYENGRKIAGTEYIKELPYYKELIKKYKKLTYLIESVCIFLILMTLILLSRPAKIENIENQNHSRDIFLCMDVSASVDELNFELVDNLKKTVNSLKGERFGISIFNSSSVLISPLTDDYQYILEELDKLHESIEINMKNNSSIDKWEESQYIIYGTQEGADIRGSSLIGEGLASCVYNFSNIEEERSRIIIFTTDNNLAGKEIINLIDSAKLCKEKNIIVFGIAPDTIQENDEEELKKAIEFTGGKYYTMSDKSQVQDIINNIENTSKSFIEGNREIRKYDKPLIPFIFVIIGITVLFILDKKVNI